MAEFIEVARQLKRLCDGNICTECPLARTRTRTYTCRAWILEKAETAEPIIMDWAAKHPEKTMKDVLLEKFPKAKLRDDGTPIACPHYLGFPAMANVCFQPTQCADCWSRPAPEE